MNEKLNILKQKANRLPLTPGVYIMKNKSGEIIYIGKARALKNRVTQYFGKGVSTPKRCGRWFLMWRILITFSAQVSLKH